MEEEYRNNMTLKEWLQECSAKLKGETFDKSIPYGGGVRIYPENEGKDLQIDVDTHLSKIEDYKRDNGIYVIEEEINPPKRYRL